MIFAAVTKNIKSMYSSNEFERLFIRYKAEAMQRKSMVQDTRHEIVPIQVRKKSECEILSYKNDDKHPYDKRNKY